MRIAICTDQYLPLLSGAVDSIALLARELRGSGHAVRIYAPQMQGAESDEAVFRAPSIELPGGIAIVAPFGMLEDLMAFEPDVMHSHFAGIIGITAWRAARRLRAPLVGTDHTLPAFYLHYAHLDAQPFRYLVKKLSAWYYQRCDLVTAPSQMMLDELKRYGMRRPCRVISNHIPHDLFRPLSDKTALKKKYGVGERAVLLFGRVASEKNLEVALDAFQALARTADAQLVVVGDGAYRAALEASVKRRGLEEKVRMLGVLRGEPLVEAINACDVLLIASKSETQSMTTLQALACEVPAVAARAGGLPEYVHNGDNGYLVEPDEPEAYAKRLQEILDDPALARRLGKAGRESVLPFSPDHIAAEFQEVYARAIDELKT